MIRLLNEDHNEWDQYKWLKPEWDKHNPFHDTTPPIKYVAFEELDNGINISARFDNNIESRSTERCAIQVTFDNGDRIIGRFQYVFPTEADKSFDKVLKKIERLEDCDKEDVRKIFQQLPKFSNAF